MPEDVTRVHIVNLKGFMWKDDEDNVVPTCTCPANINAKDCCAGIMAVLLERDEFKVWYGKSNTFFRKELLSRRLRADCDPVSVNLTRSASLHNLIPRQLLDIEEHRRIMQKQLQAAANSTTAHDSSAKEPSLLTAEELRQQFDLLLAEAGTDQISVSAKVIYVVHYDSTALIALSVAKNTRFYCGCSVDSDLQREGQEHHAQDDRQTKTRACRGPHESEGWCGQAEAEDTESGCSNVCRKPKQSNQQNQDPEEDETFISRQCRPHSSRQADFLHFLQQAHQ